MCTSYTLINVCSGHITGSHMHRKGLQKLMAICIMCAYNTHHVPMHDEPDCVCPSQQRKTEPPLTGLKYALLAAIL